MSKDGWARMPCIESLSRTFNPKILNILFIKMLFRNTWRIHEYFSVCQEDEQDVNSVINFYILSFYLQFIKMCSYVLCQQQICPCSFILEKDYSVKGLAFLFSTQLSHIFKLMEHTCSQLCTVRCTLWTIGYSLIFQPRPP